MTKTTDYKIQKYSLHYLQSFTELLDKSFDIEGKDKKELVQWKLFSDYHKGKTITYIALDETDIVASQYTNLPVRIAFGDQIYSSMICVDMATDPNHRGKGLITKLSQKVYEEVAKNKYDFTIGFSNDNGLKVDKNASNYGYKVVGRFVRYFKVVIYRKNINSKIILTDHFEVNSIFGTQTNYFRVYKDFDHLNWRYLRKPNSEYSIYKIIHNNVSAGYVVLRFKGNKCYVYDILVNDITKKQMITVLRSIENKALEKGIRIIVYNVLDNKFWQTLFNRYKYFKKVNNRINYHLTVKIHNQSVPGRVILDKENWLLMNGDIL